MSRAIMIQGAGSNVGKSLVVAGLCRLAARRGIVVRPFKPQNMSNNAAVTADGGEIGRAQALQARACGVEPHTDMNPVLLKPETETGAQVIVHGKRMTTVRAREYATLKPRLMTPVLESFRRLATKADLIIVEGAGSPAEVNLRDADIANMGFAEAAGVPVILVGDIDRGGVIAQVVGTWAVLPEPDRDRIVGFLINKFRGDPRLFDDGYALISARTGWAGFGVAPWFADATRLPAEDGVDLASAGAGEVHVVVPQLSRIANFDDLDPLAQEADIRVSIIPPGDALPGDARLVILPGSKSTIADLQMLRANGWDIDIAAHVRRGGHVLGLCGGYQMLGKSIADPDGIEGPPGVVEGLGLLDVDTTMSPEKRTEIVAAHYPAGGVDVQGYEIHIGHTEGPDCVRGWLRVGARAEGAASTDGRVLGTYLHGIFSRDDFRSAFMTRIGATSSGLAFESGIETTLDALADHLETHLDVDGIFASAEKIARPDCV